LMSLRDKALIERDESGRYRLHALLRQFAEERLARDAGHQRRTLETHASYYAGRLLELGSRLDGADQIAALEQLQNDAANYSAMWRWHVEHDVIDLLDALVEPFVRFHALRSRWKALVYELQPTIARLDALSASCGATPRARTLA